MGWRGHDTVECRLAVEDAQSAAGRLVGWSAGYFGGGQYVHEEKKKGMRDQGVVLCSQPKRSSRGNKLLLLSMTGIFPQPKIIQKSACAGGPSGPP